MALAPWLPSPGPVSALCPTSDRATIRDGDKEFDGVYSLLVLHFVLDRRRESAGFAAVADTMLTIRMDYANFDDYWRPTAYGQGNVGSFFDALPEARRDQLRDAVRVAYLAGESGGPRGFASTAWAVRDVA